MPQTPPAPSLTGNSVQAFRGTECLSPGHRRSHLHSKSRLLVLLECLMSDPSTARYLRSLQQKAGCSACRGRSSARHSSWLCSFPSIEGDVS